MVFNFLKKKKKMEFGLQELSSSLKNSEANSDSLKEVKSVIKA